MSQQYPHNPNQQPQYQGQQHYPGQQQPQYQGAPAGYPGGPVPPQQKKSWFARHKTISIIGGVFAFLIVVGIAAGGGDDSSSKGSDAAASTPAKVDAKPAEKNNDKAAAPAKKKEEPAPKKLTQAEQFKAFINKNGTAAEKAASKHITKVQGGDKNNNILDTADVYTDFTGGMMGPHQGEGKLLASAFADWRDSENGLVTIYDAAGELLSNGNY
ncbi:hypothetical protein ACFYXW_12390 [Streptomyces sp. NPDC001981]|uniref:hypothetical protein n=1 Tax=Streptomyces sp. NPDC001981 TaxID=3364628 RepID=UPI00368F0CA6